MKRIFAFFIDIKTARRAWYPLFALLLVFSLAACGNDTDETRPPASEAGPDTAEAENGVQVETSLSSAEQTEGEAETQPVEQSETEEESDMLKVEAENTIHLFIGEKELPVRWEDNESVDALRELVKEQPLSIQMSMYGGFEQVGSLGTSLPRDDVETTTNAGDIVLYSGNQIVMFYGSNSWAYTRLGKAIDMSADEMAELLGNGDVMITLSD